MSKFCPNCDKKLAADVRFCPNCGHELTPAAGAAAPHSARPDQSAQSNASPKTAFATITARAYNGSGKPGLISSTRLWLKTAFHADQCMGRADYWWGYLGLSLIEFVFTCFCGSVPAGLYSTMMIILSVCIIFFAVINIFATVQRLHDAGHSGYNWLWCLTGIGAVYVLILSVLPTDWSYTKFPRNHYQIK